MQAESGQDQGAATGFEQPQIYELRRYNRTPEVPNGSLHGRSEDLETLRRECDQCNQQSALDDGFKQWWITDGQGEIIYPLETKPSVYTAPKDEFNQVMRPFEEMRCFHSPKHLHNFIFMTDDADDWANAERLRLLACEMELAAKHIRTLLEVERQR